MSIVKCALCGKTVRLADNAEHTVTECPSCGSPLPPGDEDISLPGSEAGESSDRALADAVEAFEKAMEKGEPADIDEHCALYPALGEPLRQALNIVVKLRKLPREPPFPDTPPVPERFGRYVILSELGRGGMALVFLARDTKLEREVALKVLVPDPIRGEARRIRFLREARALARIDHPNVVPIHDVGEEGSFCYLAMERMTSSLAEEGPLVREDGGGEEDIRWAAAWILEASEGLAHVHAHGILHRDIKPSNLLLGRDGRVRVSDFGLARIEEDAGITGSREAVGTVLFASPEQLRGGPVGPEADVYGLGAALYHLLVGTAPAGPLKPGEKADLPAAVPIELHSILTKALAFRAEDRYRDMVQFADDLRAFLEDRALPHAPVDSTSSRSRPEQLRGNLPVRLTSFVGRSKELVELKDIFKKTRLLTLTGTGGCGKTRLCLRLAEELGPEHKDGTWFVDLSALADPALLPQSVATVLDLRERPGRSTTQVLTGYLETKNILLVLDNCEHVVTACAVLADTLLRACPGLRVLASSREKLGTDGEQKYQVPSLTLPDPKEFPSPAELARSEAVQLFVERASAIQSGFELGEANAGHVSRICHRLDGIPLAIELAAGRLGVLSVEQIAKRLDERFQLLSGGSRQALPRHRTLRATMDWSHDLLTGGEKELFRRLSVFAGGFSLEAAEEVCADEDSSRPEILDLLSSLLDKSLVHVEERAGEMRYRLLETVGQYAGERLKEAGEEDRFRKRHRDFFLRLAEEVEPALLGPDQVEWFERLTAELGNLRAALDWCREEESGAEAGLRLLNALARFWQVRGHWKESRERLDHALAGPEADTSTFQRARGLNLAGVLAGLQGDPVSSRSLYEESLALNRKLGNKLGVANVLLNLGTARKAQGDLAAAQSLAEESLELYRELGEKKGVAKALLNLGNYAMIHGDPASARSLLEESLALKRELGDEWGITHSLNRLGSVARAQGDLPAARVLHEESLARSRELGAKRGIAMSLSDLGKVALAEEDLSSARSFCEESLKIYLELGEKWGIAEVLLNMGKIAMAREELKTARSLLARSLRISGELGERELASFTVEILGEIALQQGQSSRAVRLLSAAEAIRASIGCRLEPKLETGHGEHLDRARKALGDVPFEEASAKGLAMTLEQSVEMALREDDEP